MRSVIVSLIALLAAGCATPSTKADPKPEQEPPTSACILYQKTLSNLTLKVATVQPELVGGSPGERNRATPIDADHYTAFWSCIILTGAHRTAWCECPRGTNREFEDKMDKEKVGTIIWTP